MLVKETRILGSGYAARGRRRRRLDEKVDEKAARRSPGVARERRSQFAARQIQRAARPILAVSTTVATTPGQSQWRRRNWACGERAEGRSAAGGSRRSGTVRVESEVQKNQNPIRSGCAHGGAAEHSLWTKERAAMNIGECGACISNIR